MNKRSIILLGALILVALWLVNHRPPENINPSKNQTAALQIQKVMEEGKPAWLFFRTSTCPACVELKKTFDQLQPEYEGKVVFIDINLDDEQNRDLGRRYRIGYVPQTYILNSTGEAVFQKVGTIPEKELRNELDRAAE